MCGHKGVSMEARDAYFTSSSIVLCLASCLKLAGQCELWESAFVLWVRDMYTLVYNFMLVLGNPNSSLPAFEASILPPEPFP